MSADVVSVGGAGVDVTELENAAAPAASSGWVARLPREVPWTAVHLLTLVGAAGVLLVANRNQWFFGDEWSFVLNRGPGFGDLRLFTPHNDHWATIPLIVYWALLSTFGLTSYLPYAAVVIAFHLLLTHLLWRACLRVRATPLVATALATVFGVLGAGSENLLWAFQMGFVAAVAFGWAAILLHDHDGPFDRRDVLGWVASVAALMSSGPGVAMVGIAVLTMALRRRRLVDVALAASVPAAVFATWYLIEGRHAHRVPQPPGSEWGVIDWSWNGLAHALEHIVGVPGTGGVLVLALVAWWVMHADLIRGRTAVAGATAIGAFGFYLMTAFGRVGLGLAAGTAGRYVYVAAALLLPTAAVILTRSVPQGLAPTLAVLGLTALVAFHNVALLRADARVDSAREQAFKGYVLATVDALRSGENPAWRPPDQLNPDLTTTGLREILALDYFD
jgi:hypothetical protein